PAGRPRRSRGFGEHDLTHPRLLLEEASTEREPLGRLRAVSGDDALELVPVRLGVLPHAVVVLAELRVRNRQPELPDLWDVPVEELLARVLVGLRLDAPEDHRVVLGRDRV